MLWTLTLCRMSQCTQPTFPLCFFLAPLLFMGLRIWVVRDGKVQNLGETMPDFFLGLDLVFFFFWGGGGGGGRGRMVSVAFDVAHLSVGKFSSGQLISYRAH